MVVSHSSVGGLHGFSQWTVPSKSLNSVHLRDIDYTGLKNSAEKLKKTINGDTIPTDPETRDHFGFSRVDNVDGEVNLSGLYNGLFNYLANPPSTDEIHEWQKQNKIADGILKAYGTRESGYFAWFKKNMHVVDQKYVRSGGPKAPLVQGEKLSDEFYND